MNLKTDRHNQIKRSILENKMASQDELLESLRKAGFELTQATLSRDLKELRVGKVANIAKGSVYVLHEQLQQINQPGNAPSIPLNSVLSIVFAYHLCVIRTFPAFANTVATYIDKSQLVEIAGTVAGDDTILVLPREGYTQKDILRALGSVIPDLESKLDQ
jgi:transcriptional regulator of arginine metabolism